MITARHQDQLAHSAIPSSPVEAYIQWLLDEFDGNRWSADLTRPRLLYKVYRGVRRMPLDHRFPLRLGSSREALLASTVARSPATLEQVLAWTLYYSHGLTRVLRPAPGSIQAGHIPDRTDVGDQTVSAAITGPEPTYQLTIGRPVPSGGNLHGTELYLAVGSTMNLPAGIYHYDCVHHALDLLRPGDYLAELAACLPDGQDRLSGPIVLLPAVFFQKNHQKYSNLSYRLQMLDMGVVVEQLLFVARRFGLDGSVCFQFLDRPVHHLIGLDIREENIYAVLPLHEPDALSAGPVRQSASAINDLPPVTATHLQPFIPEPRSALLNTLYAATLLDSLPEQRSIPRDDEEPDNVADLLPLPETNFTMDMDLAEVLLRRRCTSFNAIDTSPLRTEDLATVLAYAARGNGVIRRACGGQIYCVVARVHGIPAGTYRYDPDRHALTLVNPNDPIPLLMDLAMAPNIQMHLAPVNIFLAGDYRKAGDRFGERGFRIMGIELGRLIQRIALAAAALDLASHTHLSYRIGLTVRQLLRRSTPSCLPLVSLMLGYPRRAQGGLLEAAW